MAQIGEDVDFAASILRKNGVVGIPTETVYGLAGNAMSEEAILKIYEVKNRPRFDPLIAHVDSSDKLDGLVDQVPKKAELLMEQFWPGPLTLLLKKDESVSDLLTSGSDLVAVRVPNHEMTLSLLQKLDFPLAAPSANPFGYVSPTQASHVNDQLGDKIPYILDGGSCKIGLESTIVGFEGEKPIIHRLGGVKVETIEHLIGKVELVINSSSDPRAPGMLKSHYAPGKPMIIGDIDKNLVYNERKSVGVISFSKAYDVPDENLFILSKSRDLEEAARGIFKALRQMDDSRIDVVLVDLLPEEGLGRAINDRIRRAAVS